MSPVDQHVCIAVTVDARGMLQALHVADRQTSKISDRLRRYNRSVSIRLRQVEGTSYGRPQLIHNGRKPTARRRMP